MAFDEELVFTSFAQFATHLGAVRRRIPSGMQKGLENMGLNILARTQEKFGHYQPAVGPFPAWAALTKATLERRAYRGINTANEPLLETGDLKDSYTVATNNTDGMVVVGSDSEYAIVHEVGSSIHNIPPRPVLGPAVYQYEQEHFQVFEETFLGVVLHGRYFRRLRTRNAQLAETKRGIFGNTLLDTGSEF